jgi:hypothetical protein
MSTMDDDNEELSAAILRLNGRAWGIAAGLLFGLGLFIATNILVLQGGENVGAHLSLLSVFFPGYSVSFVGSIIGFIYAFVCGYAIGRLVGGAYNAMVSPR